MNELQIVRVWVSRVTLFLLVVLTVSSIVNIYDMAAATHTAEGWTAMLVSIGIASTLSVMVYVASITDGRTRLITTIFASVAVVISATLQAALFLGRGSAVAVALAFGVGVPLFEIFLALTDSMLRKYAVAQAEVKVPRIDRKDKAPAINAPLHPTINAQPIVASVDPQPDNAEAPDAQPDDKTRALQLRSEGYTPAEAARMVGRNYATVASWYRRAEAQMNGAAQ